jgi:phosphoglycolate phosphatase-like HAD superfamily hydrolase
MSLPRLPYDCITFDMDGTLTADGDIDFQEMRSRARIPPGSDIMQRISTLSGAERDIAQAAIAQVEAEGRERTRLNEGCVDLLQALHARDVPLAILTRNNQDTLEWTLKKFALEKVFPPSLRISRDFPGRPKPHADGLLYISSLCGLHDMNRLLILLRQHDLPLDSPPCKCRYTGASTCCMEFPVQLDFILTSRLRS